MKLDQKTGFLILGAVVVLALIIISYGYYTSLPGPVTTGGQTAGQNPPGPAPTYAPQGQVVAGFPQKLILDPGATVSNSYSLSYSANNNQYTAVWNSSSSMASLYSTYKNYFQNNGWTITNDFVSIPTVRGIAGKSGTNVASVVITAQNKGSQVTISYLAQ